MRAYPLLLCLSGLLLTACGAQQALPTPDNYEAEIEAWREARLGSLTAPTGWLSLVGLHWLEQGANTIGSGEDQDIPLPEPAPAHVGTYHLLGPQIAAETEDIDGLAVSKDGYSEMSYGALQWFLIERGGRYGIRVRDTLLPTRIRLRPIEFFPIDLSYRVRATFTPAEANESVMMRNVLDMEYPVPVMGTLRFRLNGKSYTLEALDGGPNDLFLIFSDLTTGESTYGGGRYLYCARPGEDGATVIDFNKAYNPPCAFTDYATCLLPRAENRLEVALEVGEKTFGEH